ncbi:MAG TPA: hypothetical protein VLG13_02750 [Patescibacteria group bacterium]|nr:hypothetical protein [Patescibacteria group bacterium]
MKIPRLNIKKLAAKVVGRRYRWQKLASLLVAAVLVGAIVWPQRAHASTATLVPDSDVTTQWTPSTGTTHWSLVDDGVTDNTADYVQVLSTNTTASVTDEYTDTTIGGTGYGASQIVVRIYMQSTVVQSTADTISLTARLSGTLQATTTCTPTLNTWTACTATYSGTFTPTQIDSLQVQIIRNIQGTGPSSSRPDTVQVSNVYSTVTYNASPNAPTLSTPTSGATAVPVRPVFTLSATDPEGDYLRYKLIIYQSDCSTVAATADETSSQTGWSGQDAQASTAYNSGSTATYTYTIGLSGSTTYCWTAQAIDPAGSNLFGPTATPQSFTTNNYPAIPTVNSPSNGATGVSLTPQFTFRTTDAESDYLQYNITIYNAGCGATIQNGNQPSSQTGWSGQDANGGTAYVGSSTITGSTMATYTYQGTLSPGTTYGWQVNAKDPAGTNGLGSPTSCTAFTTSVTPAAPTLSTPASGATGQATTNLAFTLKTTDADNDYLEYKILLFQSDCSTPVATFDQTSTQVGWSGQDANGGNAYVGSSSLGSSTLATYTYAGVLSANTTYCWQAQAKDPGGSNTFGSLSATQLFTTNSGSTMSNIGGGTNIRGGTRFGN